MPEFSENQRARSLAQEIPPPGAGRQASISNPTALEPGSMKAISASIRCPAGQKRGTGYGARQIGLRRYIPRSNTVSEAVLQGHAQQGQRLCLAGSILDTGTYCYLTGRVGGRGSTQLPDLVRRQIPPRHDRNSQHGVDGCQGTVEGRVGGKVVAVVMHDLDQQHQQKNRAAGCPHSREEGCWLILGECVRRVGALARSQQVAQSGSGIRRSATHVNGAEHGGWLGGLRLRFGLRLTVSLCFGLDRLCGTGTGPCRLRTCLGTFGQPHGRRRLRRLFQGRLQQERLRRRWGGCRGIERRQGLQCAGSRC